MKVANLATFLNFGNVNTSDICVIFATKILGGYETGGLRPKIATDYNVHYTIIY